MKNPENILWNDVSEELNNKGYTILKKVLEASECTALIDGYDQEGLFRKTINMARYRFGSGEYKYYSYPLPSIVQRLREQLYSYLSPFANQWMMMLGNTSKYPENHAEFIELCQKNQQLRPTPLILKYQQGDFNTLHQDMYGEVYFPLQAIAFLNKPGIDYHGGQLVLTEQIPRAQSKAIVITPEQGDLVLLTTQFRPQKGTKGYYRVNMKHGVSEVSEGIRHTLGIIFHDSL